MGSARYSRVKEWSAGETLTAAELNAEYDNILNNHDPSGMDDESTNDAEMRATADPYPATTISKPTDLAGEIQRLRFQFLAVVKALNGNSGTYWYEDIPTSPILKTPQIQDTSSDHQYVFAVSELAADRTVTLPLLTGDDEFVFKDHTQTLNAKTLTSCGGIEFDGTNTLKTKIVDIGDWNMDTTTNVDVAHGLTFTNIRNVNVMIRRDDNTIYTPLDGGQNTINGDNQGNVNTIDSTNINLTRVTGGTFDSNNWDSTSYNRGWMIITYII